MSISTLQNLKINIIKCDDKYITEGFGTLNNKLVHFIIDTVSQLIIFEINNAQYTSNSNNVINFFKNKIIYA